MALLARLSSRVGLSPIPLYLVAGLAVGTGGLVPLDLSEEFIALGADIGVVLLLFMLGLEYTSAELRGALRDGLPVGLVNVGLNLVPGVLAGFALGFSPLGALALGGITYATSSGVSAKVLTDLERLGNRETPAVLGILVLEDLSMAIYLPVLVALLVGTGVAQGVLSLAVALLAVAIALVLALRYGERISSVIASRSQEVVLLTVLGLILVVAGIAEELQVSSAVGAFLVGLALSGGVADRARALLGPLRDLFAATFFLFFGLQIVPGTLLDMLGIAVALAVVTGLTKIATGWLAATRLGVGRFGRWRAGAALVPRGEFSIVVAGLAAGVEPDLSPLAAAYVLLLAFVGPVLMRFADPIVSWVVDRTPGARAARGA
ncbi:cation:proton antiporter [Egibacter rhizosphaerae]|uniref:Cation:proton antiporter n=2 Tax=Egibacter rhizosphaerae TaxID=1670831 RepID=A0A411YLP0_9ACTN|nr:cation:proton antiporter [Egibacter rhizosphaerae]